MNLSVSINESLYFNYDHYLQTDETLKKRTFRKFTFRGVDLDQLLDMPAWVSVCLHLSCFDTILDSYHLFSFQGTTHGSYACSCPEEVQEGFEEETYGIDEETTKSQEGSSTKWEA